MRELFIVDVSSFIYRSYYALPKLTTSKGVEVGALYGFARLIAKILKEKSEYLLACYDSKRNLRKELYPQYKANRLKVDKELILQIESSKRLLDGLGVKYLEIEGYEADDIAASCVRKFKDDFERVVITSYDKDLMQLIGANVYMWDGRSENYFDENYVVSKYGVKPSQMRDLLVLVGDSSDNIEGVEGIGFKTAAKILSKYGSLERILSFQQEELSDKSLKKIIENGFKIKRMMEIVSLKDTIDIPYTFDQLLVKINRDEAVRTLRSFEFRNIVNELGLGEDGEKEIVVMEVDRECFVSLKPSYISIFAETAVFSNLQVSIYHIRDLILDDRIKKYLYDSKELFHRFSTDGITNYDDIMIAYHLIWGASRKPDPLRIVEEAYSVSGKNPALYFKELMDEYLEKLREYKMYDLYLNEIELSKVLYRMEKEGIAVDKDYLYGLEKEFKEKVDAIYGEFSKKAGVKINLNSPKQVSEFIFNKLNIKPDPQYANIYKTKSGNYSTSEDSLRLLMPYNPEIISLILRYREYAKLVSFVENLISALKDSRIHSHFDQVLTSTGRLASSKPNLQNLPVKTPDGIKIRNAFIPDEGYLFVSFDYSQIDLRVIAELSEDEVLMDAFKKEVDVHKLTASSLFGVDYNLVTEEMRRIAKTVNFGIIYGLTPQGLALELGIDYPTASQYIKRYFEVYQGVKRWIDKTLDFVRSNGYALNFWGRRRYLNDINSKNRALKNASERMAINMPVQSGSSDIIKKAMVDIYRRFKDEKDIKLLLQIHDELVFEIKEEIVGSVVGEIVRLMENVFSFKVPLKVNVKYGKRLGELK